MSKKILVTGGAGFIGSNFIRHILHRHHDWQVINLDKLTYAGNLENLKGVESNPRYLKPGGSLAIDVYRYEWWRYLAVTRYWVRPITKRLPPETLYRWCEKYVNLMWLLARWILRSYRGTWNKGILAGDSGR